MNLANINGYAKAHIDTSAGRLLVHTAGKAKSSPVLMWPSVFADSTMYSDLAADLAEKHFLILVDGPGHGGSGPAPRGTGIREHGWAMAEILDYFAIERASIIGTSWGGMAGIIAAAGHKERVSSLILLNTPFYLGTGGNTLSNRLIVGGARILGGSSVMTRGIAGSFFLESTRNKKTELVDRFFAHMRIAKKRHLSDAVGSVLLSKISLLPYLSLIDSPTMVIAGSEDGMYPLDDMRTAAAMICGSQFEIVESGHISAIDCPDEVNGLISGFLEREIQEQQR